MKKLCIFMTATPARLFALGTCLYSFCYLHKDLDFDVVIHIEDMRDLKNITKPQISDIEALKKIHPNIKFIYTSEQKDYIYSNLKLDLFVNSNLTVPINVLTNQFIFTIINDYHFVAKIDDDMYFNSSIEKCLDDNAYVIARRSSIRERERCIRAITKLKDKYKIEAKGDISLYNGGFTIVSHKICKFTNIRDKIIDCLNKCADFGHFNSPTVEELCLSWALSELNIPIKHDVRLQVYPKYANAMTVAIHPSKIGKFWMPIEGKITSFLCPEWFFYYSRWVKLGGSEVDFIFDKNIDRADRWNQLVLPTYWMEIFQYHNLFINLIPIDQSSKIVPSYRYAINGIDREILHIRIDLLTVGDSVKSIAVNIILDSNYLSKKQLYCIQEILIKYKFISNIKRPNVYILNQDIDKKDLVLGKLHDFLNNEVCNLKSILSINNNIFKRIINKFH